MREGGAGGGGEQIKRAGITSDWRAKEREKSECRGSVSQTRVFPVSPIKLVDMWKEMEERKGGGDEGQREEAD